MAFEAPLRIIFADGLEEGVGGELEVRLLGQGCHSRLISVAGISKPRLREHPTTNFKNRATMADKGKITAKYY